MSLRLTPASTVAEERKVVTVLFCDLVGFTAASDAADPEDIRARIRPYHQLLRSTIESYGGTVEKFIGDAVMAVFGAPVAHEDDPERALRAALRILEAIEELNEERELGLAVRIAVETGEALVALGSRPEEGEGIVTGDVVNTASRLQGVAPAGGAVAGQGTFRATERIFEWEQLPDVQVKGKAEPLPLWRVLGARGRFGVDLTRTHATPLVGRELERNLLTGTLERSIREQSVNLVTLIGEPGVGKSRLVAELFAFIEDYPDLVTWRQGRCLPYGEGISFWALGEIVKAEAGILESDGPKEAAAKIDAIVPDDHPDAPWLRQRLRPLVGLEAPAAAREENFAAWRTFLESMCEAHPSVFVVEDLHWADEAMLDFVEHLADYAEAVPMLILTTTRPELFERASGFAREARNSNRVNLGPLSEAETAALVSQLLKSAALPAEVQQTIVERSGGNPLYAEEFVRLLKDAGILRKEGRTWKLQPGTEIPMPSGVQGLIAARLDTLDADRKQLLQDASVIGKVFWVGAVAEMGERVPARVAEVMHELSRKELVRPTRRSSMKGEAQYSFWHSLVRDVCYAQIPRAQRVTKHAAAAIWIERTAGERVEDLAEILASHYETALALAGAAGVAADVDALAASARRFLTLAGDRALGLDSASAEVSYRRALELTPTDDPGRARVLARLAEALLERAHFAEADTAFREAFEGYQASGDIRAAAVAMARRSIALSRLGDPSYREVIVEALALLERLPAGPELVVVVAEEAGANVVSGDLRACVASSRRAISLARDLGLPEPERALGFLGLGRGVLGEAEGLDDLRRALELALARGLGREAAVIQSNLAEMLRSIEGPRAALETYREAVDFAERRGIEEFALVGATGCLQTLADLGSFDDVLAAALEVERRAGAAGSTEDLIAERTARLRVLVARGDFDGAEGMADWLVRTARELGDAQSIAYTFPTAATSHAARGEPAMAAALLDELERSPNVREIPDYFLALAGSIRTALAGGDLELAQSLATGVEPLFPLHHHALATAEALLAEADGRQAEAEALFLQAAAGWDALEIPYERAYALLGRGRCLLALSRPGASTEPLREAREIFSMLGAVPAIAECDDLLARSAAKSS